MNFRQKIADKPGKQTREDEQRENLGENKAESLPEVLALHRLYHRHDKRNKNCRKKVDEDGICRDSGYITSQLTGHHRCCRSRWTDQTEHYALNDYYLFRMISRQPQ